MSRTPAFASIVLAGLLPAWAAALGLGEIESKSFLNQPLSAERPVVSDDPTLQRLQWLGVEVELLSGDAAGAVAQVAKELDVVAWRGGVSPAQKLERVRALQAQGAIVAMVGDGVNDAPVLAGADVSVAMGSGTQLAHASADMVILSERLANLATGVAAARKTRGIIRENLLWALLYNLVAISPAAAGWVTPWMASIGMSASSLVVVLNALRLKRIQQ